MVCNTFQRIVLSAKGTLKPSSTSSEKPINPVVYVVDDDISVREALSSLIRSAGLRVETFSSAREFLSQSLSNAPCCLVLDVRLPDRGRYASRGAARDRSRDFRPRVDHRDASTHAGAERPLAGGVSIGGHLAEAGEVNGRRRHCSEAEIARRIDAADRASDERSHGGKARGNSALPTTTRRSHALWRSLDVSALVIYEFLESRTCSEEKIPRNANAMGVQ